MKKWSIILVLATVVLWSCQNKQTKKEPLEVYEYSQLALLMLQMYETNDAWKTAILNDNFEASFPENFKGIHTVTPTDANVRNGEFTVLADAYLQSVEDLLDTKKDKKLVKRFNASVDACIKCHEVFCQGPIDKISKLYIAE